MKKRVTLDILFYVGIPLFVWDVYREQWGDYLTILLGMVPAVIYTMVTFIVNREFNITGIFFLSLILVNFVMNLLSSTAEAELWNSVWLAYASIAFYSFTMLIKRPIALYFFVDYAYAKGIPRADSRALYTRPDNFHYFYKFTLFLCFREVVVIAVKTLMINELGVDGFNTIQITSSVINYIFTGLTLLFVIYIVKKITHGLPGHE